MNENDTILLKKSNEAGKQPQSSDLAYGEISVNYHKDGEKMFLKNDSNEIVSIDATKNIANEAQLNGYSGDTTVINTATTINEAFKQTMQVIIEDEEVTAAALTELHEEKVSSNDIKEIVVMTQSQYDALTTKVNTTLYLITT